MSDSNAVSVPCEKGDTNGDDNPVSEDVPYREAVGNLMYLATGSRPDIAYAVSVVSERLENPKIPDWNAVKRIFKYLKGTSGYGLLYPRKCEKQHLEVFSDADYAGDIKTRHSRSGIVSKFNEGAISWMSKKQKSVVLSTTEAEYVAASEGAKELIWLHRLLHELKPVQNQPILLVDNASAIKLAKNPEFHKRSKHIDVRYHFVREKYLEGSFDIKHINSESQIADILTKPLPRIQFQKLRSELGLMCLSHD